VVSHDGSVVGQTGAITRCPSTRQDGHPGRHGSDVGGRCNQCTSNRPSGRSPGTTVPLRAGTHSTRTRQNRSSQWSSGPTTTVPRCSPSDESRVTNIRAVPLSVACR
jgi:hypothetical protein